MTMLSGNQPPSHYKNHHRYVGKMNFGKADQCQSGRYRPWWLSWLDDKKAQKGAPANRWTDIIGVIKVWLGEQNILVPAISGVPFQGYCYFYFINIYMCARVCTRTYSHLRAFVNNNQALVLKFWDHLEILNKIIRVNHMYKRRPNIGPLH